MTLIPKLTVTENIFLGREQTKLGIIDHHQLYSDTNRLLKDFALGIPIQTPIEHLGIGQQQMVEIIKVLLQDARVLVLDEPTAALTEAEIKALLQILNQLRDKGITCIYIIHKLKEVFAIADRVTVLRDGQTIGTLSTGKANESQIIQMIVGRKLDYQRQSDDELKKGQTDNTTDLALQVNNLNAYYVGRPHQIIVEKY